MALDEQIGRFFDQLYHRRYKEALAAADGLALPRDNLLALGLQDALRAAAFLGLGRDSESARLFAQAQQRAPDLELIDHLQFEAGMLTEKFDVASLGLDRVLSKHPDTLKEMNEQLVWWLLREQPEGSSTAADDRRVALARAGFGGNDGDWLTKSAIAILLKRGDVAGASELLRYVDDPQTVENMLVLRSYAPLWPALEAHAGPALANVRRSSVTAALNHYTSDPSSERLHPLINAYRHAGQLQDAIALRAKLPTGSGLRTASEAEAWGINNAALALHEAGRQDEADQLFASLNNTVQGADSWLISMMINRLELLVTAGKFDRALPLLQPTAELAKTGGNPYAQQLVRRLNYCTYMRLGQTSKAQALLPDLLAHSKDAPAPTIDALICGDNLDAAEQVLQNSLQEREFQEDLVRHLQPKPLTADDPSVWNVGWEKLRARPAVATAYARLGRDMPAAFLVP